MGHLVGIELALVHGGIDLRVPGLHERPQELERRKHVAVGGALVAALAIHPQPDFPVGRIERGPQERRSKRGSHQAGERGLTVLSRLEVERPEHLHGHAVVGLVEGEQDLERVFAGGVLVGLGFQPRRQDHIEHLLAGVAMAGEEGLKVVERLCHSRFPEFRAPSGDERDSANGP